MANPNFVATMSSNEIWRDLDDTRCITDDLDAIESDIADLESGKANSDHSHSGYATSDHSHSGYASATHDHSYNDLSDKPTIPSAYTHPANHPASMITGLATVATTGKYSDLEGKPTIPTVPSSLPANGGNADTVDGKHATDFAEAGHNHDTVYMAKALQFVNDVGGVEYSYGADSGKNLLTEIASMPQGVHTAYSISTNAGNPTANESWRCLIHKTAVNFGWVMAFGGAGSIYNNYLDNGNWTGWNAIYEANPEPLWTGTWYMNASQEVVPSKTLSECRNGWVLVWSDFNIDTGAAVNSEACTTYIPKRGLTGGKWTGQCFLSVLPAAMTETADAITVKRVQVYDAKLTGHAYNAVAPRNDIVLRAIYEY